ncbi:hypothetical protein RUA4292_01652 [Ruegeria atlantica]|uniref:Uncharacterized protein n=1 Tax=Ruegeria atlantica TaxID=81569 RepID=A0A0P1EDQ9_9RHOB|nr:hypothetical protein RUM4293_03856 [Ruegeria atlantica]CUH47481.1 hypothetical protein RUA4292_01652 [Ruegeria atlantica]
MFRRITSADRGRTKVATKTVGETWIPRCNPALDCHSGLTERGVPFIFNCVIDTSLRLPLRNFEAPFFASIALAPLSWTLS